MASSLKHLLEAIDIAHNEHEMRSHLVPKIREHFAAERSGIFFFDRLKTDRKLQQILNVALSIERNPIARYLAEHHAPVHEGLVTSPKTWAIVCPRPDHWHVMAGPIVDRGQLVGAVGCTRSKSGQAFNPENLADLSAICLHLSVWAATVRFARNSTTKLEERPAFRSDRLTSRELQIAQLVALGRTNAEIGFELWITENSVKQALKRMFRKLAVSSRAEMTAQLCAPESFPKTFAAPVI